eukprot:1798657-Rhodomonas_salina.1
MSRFSPCTSLLLLCSPCFALDCPSYCCGSSARVAIPLTAKRLTARYAKDSEYEPDAKELRHMLYQEIGELCSRFWTQLEPDEEHKVETSGVRYMLKRSGPKLLIDCQHFETKLGELVPNAI